MSRSTRRPQPCLVALAILATAMPTWALVPPKNADQPIPAAGLDRVRDDRAGAYTAANPLAGVVPSNINARKTAGTLNLSVLSGSFDYVVLPGKFLDSGADPWAPSELADELFLPGYSGLGRPGSLRDYFNEVSYGNYLIDGSVEPWVTTAQNEAFYLGAAGCNGLCASTTESAGGFIDEVIALNDSTVDFAQYDNDGPDGLPNSGDDDGVVDLLVVVQASSGGECGSSKLWSHFGRYSDWFGGTYTTNDAAAGGGSIVIEDYALVPALDCDNSSLVTIGPFAHVFGLHLGLPALWDRDSSSRGAGAFDVMARGMWGGDGNSPERPTHPSAYTKALAGWIVPQRVTGTELGASIPAVETNATAREFNRPDICSHEEYLLLENRQKTGFDSLLPGDGLLIWHADDSTATADEEARPRLHLVPGDARYGLNNGRNDGDFGDPWPGSAGRVSFRDDTDPSSRRWDDRPSGVSVNSISQSGDPMTADLNQDTGLLLDLRQVSFDDGLPGLGDGDGAIDPYETVRLTLAISNEGQLDATGISGTLSLNPPVAGVTITDNSHNWPDLTPCGASSDGIFEISLDETVACETALDFQLDLTTDQGTTTQTFQLRVGMFFTGPPAQLTTAAEDTGTVRIASRGGEAAAVYNEPSAGRQVIRMTRLDAQSSLLGTTDISAATAGNAVDPDVAWNGTEYGVTWEDDRDGTAEIYFARVDSAGVRIGSEVRVTTQAGQSSHPRIAWSSADSRWMIVWDDDRNGDTDVYFAALDSAGAKVVGDVLIASGVGQQSYPDLSWNGQRLGIVWQDDSTGEWTIRFVATDASGTAQSPVKRLEEGLGDTIRPAVAWNASGGTFGVVFIDYADGKTRPFIRATRMTQDGGLPVSVKPISEVMFRTDSVDIDSDGTNHFVIWTDHRDGRRSVRVSRTDDRFNIQLDSLRVADDTAHGQQVGIDFDSGQLYGVWLAEDATSHRIDAFARPFNTSFECGRDDDGDGVTQPGDNCPSTPNPDQADADSDNWGDACDCDDIDPNVNPGQPETICDNIDNDCDASSADAPDNDNDGVDQCDVGAANNPDGVGVDCDDTDPLNYPGNTEVCDGQDNDCDGSIDEDFPVLTWYRDADNDLYGDPNVTLDTCDGNNQGYVSDNTDCDDTRSDVNPGQLEACSDNVDNNCDGTINEVVGTRYLDPTGDDTANTCNDQLSPCLSFNHAIRMACDGETILVAEGDYTEDVVIDHPVVIDNAGSASLTNLHGTGATDVVKILSSSVTWDGVNTDGAPNDACIHVGDATNTGLRSLNIRNTSTYGCAVGIHMESTGVTGGWNRILSMDIHSNLANGNPNSGTGILLTGGNGKLEVKVGFIRNNEGPGMRVESPPTGSTNQTIVIVGNRIQNNGTSASADGVAGIEIHDSSDVRIEGNRIYDNISTGTGDDGRGVILDNVNGGNFFCNRVENNDTGLILSGGTTGFGLLHNKWVGQAGSALAIQAASGSATTLNENNFSGNATAVDNSGDGTLDARHNWWGAADGPSGGGSGSGDPVSGPLDTSNFIARDIAPVLVKRPVDFGWSESVSACREKIQNGINNAVAGDLLLVGAGEYKEHITMSKVLDIEGLSGGAGCSPTEISGIQSSGSHLPAFRISDVAGVSLKQLTIRSTGEGTVCGQNSGEEIGLDLQNVDNSTFSDICFKQNGVTEMRVYGDSDGNSFSNLTIDGMIRDPEGTDICGHRSREGILIDGGPACESGPGASADNNTFDNIEVNYCARSFSVRLASGTDIGNSTISASPAAAWDGGTLAFGVFVQMADNTRIHDSVIGSGEETDAIRVAGKEAGSCVTERSDTVGTRIENNDITDSTGAGIRIFKQSGDLGSPVDTYLTCNDLKLNATGVLVNYVGTAPENRMYQNNITSNTEGVRNTAARAFNAQDNWWGSASGPSGSGPGTGDSVFGSVSFNPWLNNSVRIDDDVDNYAECDGDCDDSDSSINPDAAEICDGIDNDCDGTVDDGLPTNTYYRDFDGDTYGDPNNTVEDCASTPPTGYVTDNSDCDDTNDQIHPNATEIACDNVDQACDGSANEAPDDDNDGYDQCDPSDPYDGDGLPVDCDDTNGAVNPGAAEICSDNIDNECDTFVDADDSDCSGLDVTNLVFQAGSTTTLQWNAAINADSYGLYRGEIPAGGWSSYNHQCRGTQIAGTTAEQAGIPEAGEAEYFLVAGLAENATSGAITGGPLGQDSSGSSRPEADAITCGPRVYVDPDAAGAGNGLNWADAYSSVSLALGHNRATDRGLEIWIKGTVTGDPSSLDGANRPSATLLGGFLGTETDAWQRDPTANPTRWEGTGAGPLLAVTRASVVLDGLTIANSGSGVQLSSGGDRLEVLSSGVETISGRAVDLSVDDPAGGVLVVRSTTFDTASTEGIHAVATAGQLTGLVAANTFSGSSDAAIRLESRPATSDATVSVRVERNTIQGGGSGIVLGAHLSDAALTAVENSLVSSNLVYGVTVDGIRVEASGQFSTVSGSAAARAIPLLVGNTVSDGGDAGVMCSASRTDTTADPSVHRVEAAPEIWDNLLTFMGGPGIEESADDTATNLLADPLVIGNILFGNTSLYLDEGATTLPTITDVNALAGARDNLDTDPLYVDRGLNDFHIQAGSPAIDKGHPDVPGRSKTDIDGQAREQDGNGDGTASADIGADER